MTTPRIAGTSASRARNAAAVALLEANPDATIILEELPRIGHGTQRGMSARAVQFKRYHAGFQVWTRSEDDGYVRSYAKRLPSAAPSVQDKLTDLAERVQNLAVAMPLSTSSIGAAPKIRRTVGRPKAGEISPNGHRLNRVLEAAGKPVIVATYKFVEDPTEAKRRAANTAKNFGHFGFRHGTPLTTRVRVGAKTVRVEAALRA